MRPLFSLNSNLVTEKSLDIPLDFYKITLVPVGWPGGRWLWLLSTDSSANRPVQIYQPNHLGEHLVTFLSPKWNLRPRIIAAYLLWDTKEHEHVVHVYLYMKNWSTKWIAKCSNAVQKRTRVTLNLLPFWINLIEPYCDIVAWRWRVTMPSNLDLFLWPTHTKQQSRLSGNIMVLQGLKISSSETHLTCSCFCFLEYPWSKYDRLSGNGI